MYLSQSSGNIIGCSTLYIVSFPHDPLGTDSVSLSLRPNVRESSVSLVGVILLQLFFVWYSFESCKKINWHVSLNLTDFRKFTESLLRYKALRILSISVRYYIFLACFMTFEIVILWYPHASVVSLLSKIYSESVARKFSCVNVILDATYGMSFCVNLRFRLKTLLIMLTF